jgi:hypothetical protein
VNAFKVKGEVEMIIWYRGGGREMEIALINESTRVTNADADVMARACHTQLNKHLCSLWNIQPPNVKFYADKNQVPSTSIVVSLLDSYSQAGILGYHDEQNDRPEGFVFASPVLDNGGVVLFDPNNANNYAVSATASHEIVELIGDIRADIYCDGPALPQGSSYAYELADPVESQNYTTYVSYNGTTVKVFLSNFVLPNWFDQQSPGSTTANPIWYDYLKSLTKPFTMSSGGYMIVRNAPGSETSVFGYGMPSWKREMKTNELSRFSRRLR